MNITDEILEEEIKCQSLRAAATASAKSRAINNKQAKLFFYRSQSIVFLPLDSYLPKFHSFEGRYELHD